MFRLSAPEQFQMRVFYVGVSVVSVWLLLDTIAAVDSVNERALYVVVVFYC